MSNYINEPIIKGNKKTFKSDYQKRKERGCPGCEDTNRVETPKVETSTETPTEAQKPTPTRGRSIRKES